MSFVKVPRHGRSMANRALAAAALLFSLVQTVSAEESLSAARPIAARQSLFLEELTWMEVRDLLLNGFTTVIVASGGVEANGPYTVLGKHNYLTERTATAIAQKLGHTLIAPIISYVPEGEINPPTMHMRYPGTLSISETTYRSLVRESCESLAQHGFTTILLLGDSYGNQDGMRVVAEELTERWKSTQQRVYFIPEYYDVPGLKRWFAERGITERPEGIHDDVTYATMLLAIDPTLIRSDERKSAKRFSINGVSLAPIEKMRELGRAAIDFRAQSTVNAVHRRLAAEHRDIAVPLAETKRQLLQPE